MKFKRIIFYLLPVGIHLIVLLVGINIVAIVSMGFWMAYYLVLENQNKTYLYPLAFLLFLTPVIEYLFWNELESISAYFSKTATLLSLLIAMLYVLRFGAKGQDRNQIDRVKLTVVLASSFLYTFFAFRSDPLFLPFPVGSSSFAYFCGVTLLFFRFRKKKELAPSSATSLIILILSGTLFISVLFSVKTDELIRKSDGKKVAHLIRENPLPL